MIKNDTKVSFLADWRAKVRQGAYGDKKSTESTFCRLVGASRRRYTWLHHQFSAQSAENGLKIGDVGRWNFSQNFVKTALTSGIGEKDFHLGTRGYGAGTLGLAKISPNWRRLGPGPAALGELCAASRQDMPTARNLVNFDQFLVIFGHLGAYGDEFEANGLCARKIKIKLRKSWSQRPNM